MLARISEPVASSGMENPYQVSESASGSAVYPLASPAAFQSLAATKPWVRLCSIAVFTLGGILLLASVVGLIAGFSSAAGVAEAAFRVAALLPSLAVGFIALILAGKLWGYGSAINRLINSQEPHDMDRAIDAHRRFWRLAGASSCFSSWPSWGCLWS